MTASASRARSARRLGAMLLVVALVVGFEHPAGLRAFPARVLYAAESWLRRPEKGRVAWMTANATEEGLNGTVLDSLRRALAAQGTEAFLVVRGNHVAYEWYPSWSGPNTRHGTAAMAKAVTGTIMLLAAATDRRIGLDDPAWKYIPAWQGDSIRSRIRIRDLASHESGMDDVDFSDPGDGWKRQYFEHRDERFTIALLRAPILFPPGTRVAYSGVGYYALAYALASSLQPQYDVRTFLQERIMQPLGIPDADWRLSYDEWYRLDGMTLYAIGSGASYTARAAARMGELMLDRGRWDGRWLLDSGLVARAVRPAAGLLPPDKNGYQRSPPGEVSGWEINSRGSWPEVPRDAFAGIGAGHNVILVVPSLDLVMVRLGRTLWPNDPDFEAVLRDSLFDPLMHAVIGPSSRMRLGVAPRP